MAMAPTDDDNLPEGLRADLHRLTPSLPAGIADREQGLLDHARAVLGQQRGPGTGWRWLAAGAAVAAMLLIAVTVFRSGDFPVANSLNIKRPAQLTESPKPTIIDAMIAARRSGAKQPEVDQIAMAAVALNIPEVHQ